MEGKQAVQIVTLKELEEEPLKQSMEKNKSRLLEWRQAFGKWYLRQLSDA